jgi:hypothetical protein
MKHAPLLSSLVKSPSAPSILSGLTESLKRARGARDDGNEGGQPSAETGMKSFRLVSAKMVQVSQVQPK